ncbi:MAG TPA: response regulator, partial [Thermoanaerobaculia bacterium]|nr:response regulator [Thermoanaerobaculia bacterium]
MQERVVIVDDEPAIRGLLQAFLSPLPYEVRAAQDGSEALALAAEAPHPALVISDIEMPGISGVELLERIKELDETIQ